MKRDKNLEAIGNRIQKARKAKGLSQEALAELLDVSRNYVGMIERGERNPSVLTLIQIGITLDKHPAEFFGGLTL